MTTILQYELRFFKYNGSPQLSDDLKYFNQQITIQVGIVGDPYECLTRKNIVIENIPLNLGEGILGYIQQCLLNYMEENYPTITIEN